MTKAVCALPQACCRFIGILHQDCALGDQAYGKAYLVSDKVPEDWQIDYKSVKVLSRTGAERDKCIETLTKEVSGNNAGGGTIIIGVEADHSGDRSLPQDL